VSEPAPVAIEDWIDLHGYAPREIPSVAREYVEAAARRGIFEVRLVHGRGRGVQRRRVQEVLASHWLVLGFRDAPAARGGWGATLAWLRALDRRGRARFTWDAPRDTDAYRAASRRLLEHALASACSVRFAVSERKPAVLRLSFALPFVRRVRGPDGASVLAQLERELGPPRSTKRSRERWGATQRFTSLFADYALDGRTRAYLRERALPEDWDQFAGLPEDPTLLDADGEPLLETLSSDAQVTLSLTREEYEKLGTEAVRFVRVG
jgi:Smr domain